MKRAHDQGAGRGARALLVCVSAVAVFVGGCATHSRPTSAASRARLEIAPVTGQTNPPCHPPQVLNLGRQFCLRLGTVVARNANVTGATVMYETNGSTWAVALTLDAVANARVGQLPQPETGKVPTLAEIAVIVDGHTVDELPATGSGQSLVIGSLAQTRAQAIALATSITGHAPTIQGGPTDADLTLGDHWHVALGVDDCGTWVPNWSWPPGNVTDFSAVGAGAPARAGSNGQVYAGLHSHGDGLIHMEPATPAETGPHATLGLYFQYGGWQVSADAIKFVNVDEKNGNPCGGKPGVLRWTVNGVEQHGDPADYRLRDGDTIELAFTTAGAALPPQTAVPSYAALRAILGEAP